MMKVYRISYEAGADLANRGEHIGYDYTSSDRKARRLASKARRNSHVAEITSFNVEISKRGILWALNNYGEHPDNG
jgi:hypothetical protein